MNQLQRGLYEQLIDAALEDKLVQLGNKLDVQCSQSRSADAERLAVHLSRLQRSGLSDLIESFGKKVGWNGG